MKAKHRYRKQKYLGAWAVQCQTKPRGRWYWIVIPNSGKEVQTYDDENEVDLQVFLNTQGPRYKRWFRETYIDYAR